ncbi:MAG: hypothetical protein CMN75_05930 [Spirochaeta sp.]|nr:hypothetical protein [Spirochaeta sp.]RPG06343.1 MAG: hypothetical protein CBC32_011350 [Proteobacteria bacterium TMED72]
MKIKSVLLLGILVILLGAGGAIYYVYSNLNEIVRTAIEEYGSDALGASVTVEEVSISLTEGKGQITGFRIAEPRGFGSGSAVSLGEIELGINLASIQKRDPLVIDLIRVDAPAVNYVVNAKGESNLTALQKNMEGYTASGGSTDKNPPKEGGEAIRIAIRKLSVENGQITADLSAMGLSEQKATLPAIHASDLGGKQGALPAQIAVSLGEKLVADVLVAVGRSQIAPQVNRLLNEAVGEETSRNIQGLFKGLMQNQK